MGATTSHSFDRTTWALACSVAALLWVATNAGSGGRSLPDRMYYAAIRRHVAFSAPAWLFGPAWTIWILALGVNVILFANNPVVEASTVLYTWAFALFLTWVVMFAVWTPIFFTYRQTTLALVVNILLLLVTVALAVLEPEAGETRLGVVYGLLTPIVAWLAYASTRSVAILANRTQINITLNALKRAEADRMMQRARTISLSQ